MNDHERHEPGATSAVLCLRSWTVPADVEDSIPDRPGRRRDAEHLCGLQVGHAGRCACICGRTALIASRGTEERFSQVGRTTGIPVSAAAPLPADAPVVLAPDDLRRCKVRFQQSRIDGRTGQETEEGDLHECFHVAGHRGEHRCYCGAEAPEVDFASGPAQRIVMATERPAAAPQPPPPNQDVQDAIDRLNAARTALADAAGDDRMPTWRALGAIAAERQRQRTRWGRQLHSPDRWNTILGEEAGEVAHAVNEASNHPGVAWSAAEIAHLREELVQVAAVAAAWVEHIDSIAMRGA